VPIAIDHVVVAVHDLQQTTQDYERLGFTVSIGGDHAHRGSHNALVVFQDGSYIELIAFKHEPPVKDNDWWDVLQLGDGLVDAAVISAGLVEESARLREAGLAVADPFQGGRHRPDGIEIAWRLARIATDDGVRLPFVIEDVTPHDLRVPGGPLAVHANGTTGIARVTFGVPSRAAATPAYTALFGDPMEDGTFAVGDQNITLVEPGDVPDDVATLIATRGSRPVSVTLAGTNQDLPLELTHGAAFTIA
jgi:catechol 2,3-dioxygenase-like lactoylglutathione lyase family enzyme